MYVGGVLVLLGLLAFDTKGKRGKGGDRGGVKTLDSQEGLYCLAGYIPR